MKYFENGLNKLIIFGLNQLACDAIVICRELNIDVVIFSSKRMREVQFVDLERYKKYQYCIDWIIDQSNLELYEVQELTLESVSGFIVGDTAGFSFDSPFVIKQEIINSFKGAIFNEHGAILPHGKGGGGFSWRIMDNDNEGQVVFHELVEDIDSGPIVYSENFNFPPSCKQPSDYNRYQYTKNRDGLRIFIDHLFHNNSFDTDSQQKRFSSYMPRLNTAQQAYIDWDWDVRDIVSFVNAFSYPYEGAKTYCGDQIVYILDAYIDYKIVHKHPFKRGIVFNDFEQRLYVVSNGGTLVITNYSSEANKIRVGDRLFTPRDIIEGGYKTRVIYTPEGLKQ